MQTSFFLTILNFQSVHLFTVMAEKHGRHKVFVVYYTALVVQYCPDHYNVLN